MKRVVMISAAIAALAMSSTTWAQTAAPADQPDPTRLELARQLMAASGGAQQAEVQARAMFAGMDTMIKAILPPAQARLSVLVQRDADEELIKAIPQIMDMSTRIYAQALTEKELKDYLAWEQTDSAQSIQHKLPAIKQQLFLSITPLMRDMMPKVMKSALDHACAEANCTPEDRQTIAASLAKALPAAAS
jgi:hypothetical protein